MTEKKEIAKREIDWGEYWYPSEEKREDLRELFRVHWNHPGLHKPVGPVDGSGNWEKGRDPSIHPKRTIASSCLRQGYGRAKQDENC